MTTKVLEQELRGENLEFWMNLSKKEKKLVEIIFDEYYLPSERMNAANKLEEKVRSRAKPKPEEWLRGPWRTELYNFFKAIRKIKIEVCLNELIKSVRKERFLLDAIVQRVKP